MVKPGCRWEVPDQWSEWSEWLSVGLHARNRWRLPVLMLGILFASGRRTVTSWLRAVGSVSEMARMVGLSRQRFYQLQGTAFPEPLRDSGTNRPFYDEELQ